MCDLTGIKLLFPLFAQLTLCSINFILYNVTKYAHDFLVNCSQRILCNQFRIQHELEVSTKQAIFVDSSISDTIRTCIVLGNHRAANKVKTEFKVSHFR